jgi:hypothetical protein
MYGTERTAKFLKNLKIRNTFKKNDTIKVMVGPVLWQKILQVSDQQ